MLFYYFCLMIEGSGSGSVPLTNGCGSRRPKNIRIRICIPKTNVSSGAGVSGPGAYYLPRVHAVRADQDQARGRDHARGSRARPHRRPASGSQGGNLIYSSPNAIQNRELRVRILLQGCVLCRRKSSTIFL
jgi:hypothetical protein